MLPCLPDQHVLELHAGLAVICMMDTHDLDLAEREIGIPCEQLLTPLTRRSMQRPAPHWFAVDNGAFARFHPERFVQLLERLSEDAARCRWVACPDVVGSALRTLEAFDKWESQITRLGFPVALVCQDGQESLPIPWGRIDAVFIGGSTEWKLGRFAEQTIKGAKLMGKWVHVGRVNTPGRLEHFERLGADSIDGTGIARFSAMRAAVHESIVSPRLFDVDEVLT